MPSFTGADDGPSPEPAPPRREVRLRAGCRCACPAQAYRSEIAANRDDLALAAVIDTTTLDREQLGERQLVSGRHVVRPEPSLRLHSVEPPEPQLVEAPTGPGDRRMEPPDVLVRAQEDEYAKPVAEDAVAEVEQA